MSANVLMATLLLLSEWLLVLTGPADMEEKHLDSEPREHCLLTFPALFFLFFSTLIPSEAKFYFNSAARGHGDAGV